MEVSGVSEAIVSANYEVQPVPVSRPHRKEASQPVATEELRAHDAERMQRMVEDIQKNLSNMNVSLTFSTYGPNNNQVSIVVAEKETGKVIREIPSRELQSLYTKMQEVAGMILNKRV